MNFSEGTTKPVKWLNVERRKQLKVSKYQGFGFVCGNQ